MSDETRVTKIEKVRFDGKWAEFWFSKDTHPVVNNSPAMFHESSKAYLLNRAIEEADLYNEVMTNGLKGKVLEWYKPEGNFNWEIKSISINY
jgi:hypothetical protein